MREDSALEAAGVEFTIGDQPAAGDQGPLDMWSYDGAESDRERGLETQHLRRTPRISLRKLWHEANAMQRDA